MGADGRCVLPPNLTHLNMLLYVASAALINRALVAVGSLRSLVELSLTVPSLTSLDLAPLIRLDSLHTLKITSQERVSHHAVPSAFSPQQCDALRVLSRSLTSLHIAPDLSEESVRQLFAAGHSFRLTDLGHSVLRSPQTAELIAMMMSLPLERLVVWPTATRTMDLLPRLAPTLRWCQTQLGECPTGPDAIAASFSCLTGLTSLTMMRSPLTSDHLSRMMRSLPRLRRLCLSSMRELQSLAFHAEAGAPRLATFSLSNCYHVHFSPSELQHLLRAQPQLTALSIFDSFNSPLDAATRSALVIPSTVLPLLKDFRYRQR